VLQCVAGCCSVGASLETLVQLPHLHVCCSVLQCVTACCRVLQRAAAYFSVMQIEHLVCCSVRHLRHDAVRCDMTYSNIEHDVFKYLT